MINMAKRFHFDDEEENYQDEYKFDIDEINQVSFEDVDEPEDEDDSENEDVMKKKKKKFVWRWWHYLIIFFIVLMIAFGVYIFMASQNDGPVYGTRCEGLVGIPVDAISKTEDEMKNKYSSIEQLDIAVECRELRVDIVFENGMKTKKAQDIAEDIVKSLDEEVGKPKEDGKTYSTLFGTIDGTTQYEVDLFMVSQDSEDFPMYGIKHTSQDKFTYTLASIKDKDSYEDARETLDKKSE